MRTLSEPPNDKPLADGSRVRYWRRADGVIMGQVFRSNGRAESRRFVYQGDRCDLCGHGLAHEKLVKVPGGDLWCVQCALVYEEEHDDEA